MINIMVDIETTGTDPERNHMIQLSAVRFDLDNKKIDTDDMFDRCLDFAPIRYWDEGTRDWWMNQPVVLENIMARREEVIVVLHDFSKWVNKNFLYGPPRLWAKPITFEWGFLASYYRQYGMHIPFHYREAVDLNSYIRGRGHWDLKAFREGVPFHGEVHNAIDDVLNQIGDAFRA